MTDFKREERYIVVKISDLWEGDNNSWSDEELLRDFLERNEIPTRECVVIESDWPIYDQVWDMMQRMSEGRLPCRFHDDDKEACETYSGDVPCEPYPTCELECGAYGAYCKYNDEASKP